MHSKLYDDAFFSREAANSLRSAQVILPLFLEFLQTPPHRVVDVGCGMGGWLKVFAENGSGEVLGLDGDYVEQKRLLVDASCFRVIDLRRPLQLPGSFDLAICLEVAEHIEAKHAAALVKTLTAAAPLVLFSAAIPGQRGQGHINERWPSHWRQLFARESFVMLDPIRPLIRADQRVAWWYRQNLILFASPRALAVHARLAEMARDRNMELEWIHRTIAQQANRAELISDSEWIPAIQFGYPGLIDRAKRRLRALVGLRHGAGIWG